MPLKLHKNIAVSDSGMLFNPATGESFTVNPGGMLILSLMREGHTIPDIESKIGAEFEVEQEVAERDLLDFINMLKHYQLSTEHDETND